jgi:hypothetical protein
MKPLFFLLCIGLLADSPAQSTSPAPPVEATTTPTSPGEKEGVTTQMKEDFLNRYRLAVTTNDPIKYLSLICLDGMDEAMRTVAANGAAHSLSYVGGHLDLLSFEWGDPDPDDTKPFEKNGYHYHVNLKPVIALTINIKRGPDESKDLPTALQPTLGIKDGQLMILGMVHEKLPDPPGLKKEDPKEDD